MAKFPKNLFFPFDFFFQLFFAFFQEKKSKMAKLPFKGTVNRDF